MKDKTRRELETIAAWTAERMGLLYRFQMLPAGGDVYQTSIREVQEHIRDLYGMVLRIAHLLAEEER